MNRSIHISTIPLLKRSILFFVFLFNIFSINTNGNAPDINAKVKAIFLYNFSKYVEWPSNKPTETFKVAVFGDYPALVNELRLMAQQKTRGAQKFEILVFNNIDELIPCQMIYVAKDKNEELNRVIKKIRGTSSLVVTEKEGSISKGSSINFYYEDNKQKFEISPKNLATYNLKVSNQLKLLARVVN